MSSVGKETRHPLYRGDWQRSPSQNDDDSRAPNRQQLEPVAQQGQRLGGQEQPQRQLLGQDRRINHRDASAASRGSSISVALSALTTIPTGRRIVRDVQPEARDALWLAEEMLRRTDASSGDICMFHYPMDFLPTLDVNDMRSALEMIIEQGGQGGDTGDGDGAQPLRNPLENNSRETRERILRIQFSWYQFEELPRLVLGRAYANLQHLDIRQNASLSSIDSIVTQLPNLVSLNLSDCPNVRTLAPLAAATLSHRRARITDDVSSNAMQVDQDEQAEDPQPTSTSNLRHLWVRGCDLSAMPEEDWADVFDALAESTGPLERLTLSRNNIRYLHGGISKLKGLTYLFVEDNNDSYEIGDTFNLPEELGDLPRLRFLSLCGNNIRSLPRTLGRLRDNCDVHLHRNPNLQYPAPEHRCSVKAMRLFFHRERMALLHGAIRFTPHLRRARLRANERLFRPGGGGYWACKERFEESARRTSISVIFD